MELQHFRFSEVRLASGFKLSGSAFHEAGTVSTQQIWASAGGLLGDLTDMLSNS